MFMFQFFHYTCSISDLCLFLGGTDQGFCVLLSMIDLIGDPDMRHEVRSRVVESINRNDSILLDHRMRFLALMMTNIGAYLQPEIRGSIEQMIDRELVR